MSLRDWQKNSWLVEHKSSPEEITALFAIVERDLASAKEQHHYRTIQSLALTIGWLAAKVERFDRFRKKRNMIGYETARVVSEQEAREMHELAVGLRDDVLAWLRKQHPKLAGR